MADDRTDSPAIAALSETAPAPPRVLFDTDGVVAGEQIGRFVVRERLGSGGMGVVFLAHDPTLERDVAVKVIRADATDSESMRKRLLREARAMGKIAHANVVTVHEAGTAGDRVYIVMEYVPGGTLAQWLGEEIRPRAAIVTSFVRAGRGLAAAHAAGLVHRDFKPANVLMGKEGQVRVTDFGLAAIGAVPAGPDPGTSSDSGEDARLTVTGAVVGTPRYMAPEQHEGKATGPAADQFAFAVSLFEALAGRMPFAGKTPAEVKARVLTHEPEPLPESVPAWLRRVVQRGMQRDPARRYPSMTALLRDLEAGPFLSRRRILAGAAAAVAIVALAVASVAREPPCRGADKLLAGAWDGDARARLQAGLLAGKYPDGADVFARIARALDGYAGSWAAARTGVCEATAVRHEQSEALLDARMSCLDSRLRSLRALTTVLSQAENVTPNALATALNLPRPEECVEIGAPAAWDAPPPAAIAADVALLRQRIAQAQVFSELGKVKAARQAADTIVADARRLGHAPVLADALYLGAYINQFNDPARSQSLLEETLVVAADLHNDILGARAQMLRMWILGISQRHLPEALALAPVAAAAVRRAGNRDMERGELLQDVGALLTRAGRYAEAQVVLEQARHHTEKAKGANSLHAARALTGLAQLAGTRERLVECEDYARRAVAIFEAELGPTAYDLAPVVNELGGAAWRRGDLEAARGHYQRTYDLVAHVLGTENAQAAAVVSNLGDVAFDQGRYEDARGLFERSHRTSLAVMGAGDERTAEAALHLGESLIALGKLDEARPLIEGSRAILEKELGPDTEEVARALTAVARLRLAEGAAGPAIPLLERAVAIDEAAVGKDKPLVQQALVELGEAYLVARRVADAVRVLERAAAVPGARPDHAARGRFALARAVAAHEPERARTLAADARAFWVRAGRDDQVARIDAWLTSPPASRSDRTSPRR